MAGFWCATNEFFDEHAPHLSAGASGLYCYLCRKANAEGLAWPSLPTLAAALNISENTARGYLAQLQERGVISIQPRQGKKGGYSYQITSHVAGGKLVERVQKLNPSEAEKGSKTAPQRVQNLKGSEIEGVQNLSQRGSEIEPKGYSLKDTHVLPSGEENLVRYRSQDSGAVDFSENAPFPDFPEDPTPPERDPLGLLPFPDEEPALTDAPPPTVTRTVDAPPPPPVRAAPKPVPAGPAAPAPAVAETETPPETSKPRQTRPRRTSDKPPTPEGIATSRLVALYHDKFWEQTGERSAVNGGTAAGILGNALKTVRQAMGCDLEAAEAEMGRILTAFFADEFAAQKAWALNILPYKLDALRGLGVTTNATSRERDGRSAGNGDTPWAGNRRSGDEGYFTERDDERLLARASMFSPNDPAIVGARARQAERQRHRAVA